MPPTLYLALVDDWELRGNGAGDPRQMQFGPMRELVRIYEGEGIRATFMAEILQQLTFRRWQRESPHLGELADEWEQAVLETYRRGHDVQLHVHSQWKGADYGNGRWTLPGHWDLTRYDEASAREILLAAKNYLENLLRTVDANYRCVVFRAGSWCIAPSPYMVKLLAEIGIQVDISIAGGLREQTRHVDLDYTICEERFLPFYPAPEDARRVAAEPGPLVCVPTNEFTANRFRAIRSKMRMRLRQRSAPPPPQHAPGDVKPAKQSFKTRSQNLIGGVRQVMFRNPNWERTGPKSPVARAINEVRRLCDTHFVSDISRLDYALLTEMMCRNRERARASGLESLPIVLENHTKDIRDFSDIARFARDLARATDVKTITLSELATMLRSGRFAVCRRTPPWDAHS